MGPDYAVRAYGGSPVRWATLTTIGYMFGGVLSSALMGSVGRPLSQVAAGVLYIAVYGSLIGAAVASAQLVALGRDGSGQRSWILWSAFGGAVGYVGASVVGEILGNTIDPRLPVVVGEGMIEVGSGAVLGLAIGLAQGFAGTHEMARHRRWLAATLIGTSLGYGAAAGVLEFVGGPILRANLAVTFMFILGLFVAAAQALIIARSSSSGTSPS